MDSDAVTYDQESDILYVRLRELPIAATDTTDDLRLIDYSEDRAVVGVEFLQVGSGIDLSDLRDRHEIERLIDKSGLAIRIIA